VCSPEHPRTATQPLRHPSPLLPPRRPPRSVPLPTWGLVLMLAPATALLLTVLLMPVFARDWLTVSATGAALASGLALYPFLCWLKESKLVDFADLGFEFAHVLTVRRGGAASPAGAAAAAGVVPTTGAAAPAPPARTPSPGADGNAYTITATGALHYPGDDVYDGDVFVDVANDGEGHRTTSLPDGGAPAAARSLSASLGRGGGGSAASLAGARGGGGSGGPRPARGPPARSGSAPPGALLSRVAPPASPAAPRGAHAPRSPESPSRVASFKVVVSSDDDDEEAVTQAPQQQPPPPPPQGGAGGSGGSSRVGGGKRRGKKR
jgi:hypothetical protein